MQTGLDWLSACILEQATVLITVAATSGSVPREAGAKMVVTADAQFDTIGGGHLELKAIEIARGLLQASTNTGFSSTVSASSTISAAPEAITAPMVPGTPLLHRMALGPSLGQCCGGVVHLLFELIDHAARERFRMLQQRWRAGLDSWRVVALEQQQIAHLLDSSGQLMCGQPGTVPTAQQRACHILRDGKGQRYLLDPCPAWRAHLYLFGAGHVATHLVHALAHLPCHVTWVDGRAELFPPDLPGNVQVEINEHPESLIRRAAPHSSFLVMTHSHTLDQDLVEAVLVRDSLWLGLIGSHSKRARFESRLRARGIKESKLAHLVSPVGIPGIASKLPAVIAASVCAQLLQVWQQAGQLDTGHGLLPLTAGANAPDDEAEHDLAAAAANELGEMAVPEIAGQMN